MTPVDDWVLLCGTSQDLFLRGTKVATRSNQIAGNQAVSINAGYRGSTEKSDWAVAEVITWDRALTHPRTYSLTHPLTQVITWDRALSDEEMGMASAYLQNVLDGSCPALSGNVCICVRACVRFPVWVIYVYVYCIGFVYEVCLYMCVFSCMNYAIRNLLDKTG